MKENSEIYEENVCIINKTKQKKILKCKRDVWCIIKMI